MHHCADSAFLCRFCFLFKFGFLVQVPLLCRFHFLVQVLLFVQILSSSTNFCMISCRSIKIPLFHADCTFHADSAFLCRFSVLCRFHFFVQILLFVQIPLLIIDFIVAMKPNRYRMTNKAKKMLLCNSNVSLRSVINVVFTREDLFTIPLKLTYHSQIMIDLLSL